MERTIDIIVPTHNQYDDLIACLRSLDSSIVRKDFNVNVIVVDDHSSKDVRSNIITNIVKFKDSFKHINVSTILLSKSHGFAKACNIGLEVSYSKKKQPDFVGLFHDDIIIATENWLNDMIDALDEDIDAKIAVALSNNEFDRHSIKSLNIRELTNVEIAEDNIVDVVNTFLKNKPNYAAKEAKFFAAITKNDQKILLNEHTLSPLTAEHEICKKINDENKKVIIVPKACILHKSRTSSPYENPNQQSLITEMNAAKQVDNIIAKLNDKTKKYVVYTYLRYGQKLPKIDNMSTRVDYVYFTINNNDVQPDPWKRIVVDDISKFISNGADNKMMKEYIKLNPHHFLKNYEVSIWTDLYAISDPTALVKLMTKDDFIVGMDEECDCIYRKLIKMRENGEIGREKFDNMIHLYRWCMYPAKNGLIDSSLLIRKHNLQNCIDVMNKTWNFVKSNEVSSVLLLNFSLWLYKENYKCIPNFIAKNNIIKEM